MAVGGQTRARVSTVVDYHAPLDQGFSVPEKKNAGREEFSLLLMLAAGIHKFTATHNTPCNDC